MSKYNFAFEVKVWNENDVTENIIYCIIPEESFSKAVNILEAYYGEELTGFSVESLEYSPVFLNENSMAMNMKGEDREPSKI